MESEDIMEQKKNNTGKIVIIVVLIAVICILAAVAGWFFGKKNTEVSSNNVPQMTEGPKEVADGGEAVTTERPIAEEVTPVPDAQETEVPNTTDVPTEAPTMVPSKQETPEPTKAPVPDGPGPLHVEGSMLCDENGELVQLRGISTHGMAWFPQYINEECFKEFKEDWNANVVRLAMYTAENGGYCTGGNKDDLKQLVKDGVEYATNNDLYVIIDWHILSDNNPNTYKDEAKKFFDEMSEAYKDYPNVIYEICNEPNGGTSWRDIKSYAEEVIGVIRENDEDNIIIVGTPNWSQYVDQAAADPITEYDNIMYALHYYAATHKEDLRKKMVNAYNAGLPIFVTEYGICDASGNGAIDEYQANAWVDEMNTYGISYVAWNLSNKNETSAIIKSSCNKVSGFTQEDLSQSGKWLYTMLTGHDAKELAGDVGTNANKNPSGQSPTQNSQTPTATQAPASSGASTVASGSVTATVELRDSWQSEGKSCFNYNVTVSNTTDSKIENWKVEIVFSDTISLNQGWSGEYTINGKTLQISPVSYNAAIEAGQSVSDIGFIIEGSESLHIVE